MVVTAKVARMPKDLRKPSSPDRLLFIQVTDTLRDKLIRKGWVTPFNVDTLVRLIEDHYADEPAVPEGREPAAVISEPSDAELLCIAAEAIDGYGNGINPGDYEPATECAVEAYGSELCAYARAVLARWGNLKASLTSSPPADGEVAELVEWLRANSSGIYRPAARAAELLQLQALQTLPQGLIPMEYVDADSSARIVSEPSEDGPGGCWVVRNSRHVNPCTEFPTAEAAWDALQRAHALPLPEVSE